MRKIVKTESSYKGFFLSNDIKIDDYLSIIVGKNGCGKTRLLESFNNNNSLIFEEGNPDSRLKNFILDLSVIDSNFFKPLPYNEMIKRASSGILGHLYLYQERPDIQLRIVSVDITIEGPVHFMSTIEFDLEYLNSLTLKYLDKNIGKVIQEELELILCIDSYLLRKLSPDPTRTYLNLSCLIQNYFLTLRTNKYLGFLNQENSDIKFINNDIIEEKWRVDPFTLINQIITNLFNNKFSLSPPKEGSEHLFFIPQLVFNANSTNISLDDLSHGEKTIFMLAALTINSATNSSIENDNLTKIILLDEPDSHLHPKMVEDMYHCFEALNKALSVEFILTTHSPTTVALAPTDSIFSLNYDSITDKYISEKISKDVAISELLDGINTISIDPKNNRQVYVESFHDMAIYNEIYKFLYNGGQLKPGINLNFIPSGAKYDKDHIIKIATDAQLSVETIAGFEHFVERLNGEGNCEQVRSTVKGLSDIHSRTVRGVIDWDNKNKPSENIIVNGEGIYYSIENIIYEPIVIFFTLTTFFPSRYTASDFCSIPKDWAGDEYDEIMSSQKYQQEITDDIISKILGVPNNKDQPVFFLKQEFEILGDKRYYNPRYDDKNNGINGIKCGHDLECKILENYNELMGEFHRNKNIAGGLMLKIVQSIIIRNKKGRFLNKCFLDTFKNLL